MWEQFLSDPNFWSGLGLFAFVTVVLALAAKKLFQRYEAAIKKQIAMLEADLKTERAEAKQDREKYRGSMNNLNETLKKNTEVMEEVLTNTSKIPIITTKITEVERDIRDLKYKLT